jgi:DegV family protein with EDD domain
VVPLTIAFGERVLSGGERLDRAAFSALLQAAPGPPQTAAPPPASFLDTFRRAGKPAVVCVMVSPRFSTTYANAVVAAREAHSEGIDVAVVDSGYAAMAEGYVALAAARAAQAGKSLEAVRAAAEAATHRVGLIAVLENLDYLARGGRVPRVAAWATSLLRVRPIVEFRDREIRLAGRARTRRRALDSLLELLERRSRGAARLHVSVQHADAEEDARELLAALRARFRPASSGISEFSLVMTAHVGPGLVGVAYWREE